MVTEGYNLAMTGGVMMATGISEEGVGVLTEFSKDMYNAVTKCLFDNESGRVRGEWVRVAQGGVNRLAGARVTPVIQPSM
jgi:hypothetical protein